MRRTNNARRGLGIRGQLMFFLCFICLFLLVLFWILSTQLLEPLYTRHIERQLTTQAENVVSQLDDALAEGTALSSWSFGRLYINQQPAPAYAPASPQTPAPKKSGTGPLIAVIVVLVAIIIALVIFFAIRPFDNAATQTTAEVAKLHHDVDDDDLKPLGNPNSLYDDDDEDGGEATLSEQNLYRRLSEYYDLLEDLDSQVRGCAQNFNGNYLEEDRTTRQNLADVAERTEDTIEQYYDIVEDLDVPTSSKNYSSWKDIIALYDDLDHRIDAICDAWEISLKYAKPADHKNEIVAPLSRDNVAGTNDNKYRLDFEERYPGAKPVEVN